MKRSSHAFRVAALLLAGLVASSGCRCGGRQVTAPEPAARTSGCRLDGTVGEVRGLVRTVQVDGTQRGYVLDVPGGDAGIRRPVVLGFHGIGDSPEAFREATGLGERAHDRGFIAVHPRGESVWLKGRVGPGWQIKAEDNRDVRLTSAIIGQLDSLYCVDRDRVYAAGFSNGAHLAHVLGCRLHGTIAAIGAVGGGLNEMSGACGPVHHVPAAIIHGAGDSIVGVEEGREAHEFWVQRNDCEAGVQEGQVCVRHACGSGPGVLYCELPSLGHSWPSSAMGDPIDATKVLLDFFLAEAEDGAPDPAVPSDPEPQEARGMTLHFQAKVVKIVMLGEAKGSVIPVHPDPRWAMSVRILSVKEDGSPLTPGGITILGIHSPAKLFAADAGKVTGKTYDFKLEAEETGPGTWSFGVLRVVENH